MIYSWLTLMLVSALNPTPVYTAGADGYHTYRIPAIVAAANGDLLAFAEGRVNGMGDSGNIDLVLKRSSDSGKTWGPLQVIADDAGNTCGNPAPVVLRESGRILLLITKNDGNTNEKQIQLGEGPPRTVWIMYSDDHGATWSEPRDISPQGRRENWRWYATGPGHALQLKSGRIVVPCNHSDGSNHEHHRSHILYSDDQGEKWAIGAIQTGGTNESTLAELPDGRLYQNMRNYLFDENRVDAYSDDGGLTASDVERDHALRSATCQGTTLFLGETLDQGLLLYSGPDDTSRKRLTLRASRDAGLTWPLSLALNEDPAAYSDLAALDELNLGWLFETGKERPYETISFIRVPRSALSENPE